MSENEISIIKATVHSFQEKYIESKTVTFFNIDILNIISNLKWTVEKRYSDFQQMNDVIMKTYPNVPFLPGSSLFKVTSFEELTKGRLELEEYLTNCIKRKDIFNSFHLQRFLEIEKKCPELIGNTIEKICELNKLTYGISDFIYCGNDKVLFLGMSNDSVLSKINSMFSILNFFWEDKSSSHTTLGAVCIFHVSKNNDNEEDPNEFSFRRVWTMTFPVQIHTMHYDSISQVLSIGLEDGKVYAYQHKPGMHFIDFKEVIQKQVHVGKVTGIAYDRDTNCLYSCSIDKNFLMTDINKQTVFPIERSFFGFSRLVLDKKHERLFLANEFGQVKVFVTTTKPPTEVIQVQTSVLLPVKALTVDIVHNYIFTGADTGKICILNLGMPGKERLINQMSTFGEESGSKIRIICYNRNKNELICGDEDGKVLVWSLKTAKLQCKIIIIINRLIYSFQ